MLTSNDTLSNRLFPCLPNDKTLKTSFFFVFRIGGRIPVNSIYLLCPSRFPYLLPDVSGASLALLSLPLVLCFLPETVPKGSTDEP